MQKFQIVDTDAGCALVGVYLNTKTHLPLPITKVDARTLVRAAFKSDDDQPRAEFQGILADKTADGVRVRRVATNTWFDIPWQVLAREFG